ncbi:hypothetical protein D477_001269 [Arthrobacter crystallopoietes BAB-32]|uniref:Uncharacterized protein n=1 Tax=Arthrobacter crystallopoietes BAB-32 TaxID=1246476 RepID=N1V041_9MICC|nr:hypothetical protein [Arthrobacter crystallopoietes]EMY36021.1 hypothetical protein D477_001269 [Arthrobacter crystallopoietes BAB-32]
MSNGCSPRFPEREQAQAEWRALARLIASQPRVRLSKDGGKTYRDSGERDLSDSLPSLPAAVRTCGRDGLVRTICLDLDAGRGGQEQVDKDYRRLRQWFARNDVRWIEDQSPSGGRHLYIPLNFGVSFTDAKEFTQALAKRHPSLDPGPHENAQTGAIRVPGSPWKKGGYQRLTMSLNLAYDVAKSRNSWKHWSRLRDGVGDELAAIRQRRVEPLELLGIEESLPLQNGKRRLPEFKENIARTGSYDTARYATPSEARLGVLASAVAAGWELTDVRRLMHQNIWAGMVAFYSRYSPAQRAKYLHKEWRLALAYVQNIRKKNDGPNEADTNRHKSYTSPPDTHPPALTLLPQAKSDAEYRFLRSWRNALFLYEQTLRGSRSGLGVRMLLRALAEAATKKGSRFIEFGVRSIALATGTHETTVARQLRALAAVETPLIRLAGEARGDRADVYELVIPDEYREFAEDKAWKPGKIHALRPVFRELGVVPAFVYETIEQAGSPLIGAEIIRASGLSPRAVAQALEILAAWNLIQRKDGRWEIVTTTNLTVLAERFGVLEAIEAQMKRYRSERTAWQKWLTQRALSRQPVLAIAGDDYPYWDHEGPPDIDAENTDDALAQAS